MPVERALIDLEHGPLIRVLLSPHSSRPHSDPVEGWALIDTGAKASGVHAALATHALGWQVKGAVELHTPGTTSEAVPIYDGGFKLIKDGSLVDMDLVGLNLGYRAGDADVILILGRDFLQDKTFSYDGRKSEWTLHW